MDAQSGFSFVLGWTVGVMLKKPDYEATTRGGGLDPIADKHIGQK